MPLHAPLDFRISDRKKWFRIFATASSKMPGAARRDGELGRGCRRRRGSKWVRQSEEDGGASKRRKASRPDNPDSWNASCTVRTWTYPTTTGRVQFAFTIRAEKLTTTRQQVSLRSDNVLAHSNFKALCIKFDLCHNSTRRSTPLNIQL